MALAHAGTDFPPRASRCLCMNFACLLQICDKERFDPFESCYINYNNISCAWRQKQVTWSWDDVMNDSEDLNGFEKGSYNKISC